MHSIAVFGADDRLLLPKRMRALQSKIGLIYEPKSRSVCTAFCVDSSTIATAAHCLFRTRGEPSLSLSKLTFRLAASPRDPGTHIAGVASGSAEQNIVTGSTSLSTRPPIDATRDWALIRLAAPACRSGGLSLSPRTPAELAAPAADRQPYQVGYHRDFGDWQLTLSPPCSVRQSAGNRDDGAAARDFVDLDALILHTCDTGGASSGAPLLVDGPHGPEVVGINVGTYLQSRVFTQAGEVVHRTRSNAVANTGVSTAAFRDSYRRFSEAIVLTSRREIRRVQSALAATGHYRGAVNGRYGSALRQAIEAFERSELLVPTGLVSADLVGRLQTVVALRQRGQQDAAKAPQIETGSNPAAPADKR